METIGLFKISLVFASILATIGLSNARPLEGNIAADGSYHPWGEQISGDFDREKISRSKRFSFYGGSNRPKGRASLGYFNGPSLGYFEN